MIFAMFQQVSNLIKKIHPCRYQLSFLCLISQTGKLDFHVTSAASFDMHVTAVCGHRAEPTGTGSTKHAHSTLAGLWHRSGSARALTKQWEGIRKPLHAESHWNSQRTANNSPGKARQGKAGQGRAGPRTDASPSFSTGGGGDGRRMRGAALAAGRDGGAAGGPELQVGGGAGRPGGGGADAFRRFSPVLVLVAAAVAASAPELTLFGAVSALAARGVAGGGRSRAARREPPVEIGRASCRERV